MNFYSVIFWMFMRFMSMICDHFHSIDSQVKSIAYSCTRSLREQDGKYITNQINGSAQYVDTATTLLPCNRAPASNGQSTNMTSQTHVNVSTKHADTTAVQHTQHHGNTAVIPRSFKMNVEYICTQSVSKTSQQRTNIITTGRTITLYTARWKCYLCGMDFVKRFERPVHNATEHPDAPIFTPHDSLGDLWHPPVNLPRATKHAPMSQVASKNEHTAPSSPPLSPEETPWKAK